MNKTQRMTRRELREYLAPLVREAVEDDLGNTIKEEVQQHLKTPGTNYAELVQGGGQPRTLRGSRDLSPGVRVFARMALATAIGGGDRAAMLDAARTLDIENELKKALAAGSTVGGGALLEDATADQIIEVLRGMSIVRRAGPREIEIPAGTLRTPRIDTGTVSSFVAEGEAIPASDIATGSISLIGHKLAALTVMSNELLNFSGGDVDAIVADDLFASISETEDIAFLQGSGSQSEPLGIINAVDTGQKFAANSTVNVQNTVDDLSTAMNLLLTADVPMRNPAWLWAPRTSTYLRTLLNSNGQFVFRDEIDRGRLFGWPYFESTHVPVNLGAGNDESYIIFIDMSELMVGTVMQVALDRSNAAAVTIGGQLVSLYETDREALRTRVWVDAALRHSVGAAVMEQVKWGA